MLKWILFLIFFISSYSIADIRSVHCPLGCPSLDIEGNDVVFNYTYALSNNSKTKFADWVAYQVNVLNFGDSPGRTWRRDPLLDAEDVLEDDDYAGANAKEDYERGHLAPLASFAGHPNWRELNYLSNITPQEGVPNNNAWKHLEIAVRKAVAYQKPLYVITGTLYTESEEPLPKADESHAVPSAFYKIVYDIKGNAAGFVFDQDLPKSTSYCSQVNDLKEIYELVQYSLPRLKFSSEIFERLGC